MGRSDWSRSLAYDAIITTREVPPFFTQASKHGGQLPNKISVHSREITPSPDIQSTENFGE